MRRAHFYKILYLLLLVNLALSRGNLDSRKPITLSTANLSPVSFLAFNDSNFVATLSGQNNLYSQFFDSQGAELTPLISLVSNNTSLTLATCSLGFLEDKTGGFVVYEQYNTSSQESRISVLQFFRNGTVSQAKLITTLNSPTGCKSFHVSSTSNETAFHLFNDDHESNTISGMTIDFEGEILSQFNLSSASESNSIGAVAMFNNQTGFFIVTVAELSLNLGVFTSKGAQIGTSVSFFTRNFFKHSISYSHSMSSNLVIPLQPDIELSYLARKG
jgi:hypothetical protein